MAEKLLEHQSQSSLHECPECHLKYKEKEWAKKCEAWCRDNHSCNLEITAHAEKIKNYEKNIFDLSFVVYPQLDLGKPAFFALSRIYGRHDNGVYPP